VGAKKIRIRGSKSVLLPALVTASSGKTAGFGVPSLSGAPEEIRTPDPQIRRLVLALDFIGVFVECELIRETFQCRDGSTG
jgi:hypothetical protein